MSQQVSFIASASLSLSLPLVIKDFGMDKGNRSGYPEMDVMEMGERKLT